MKISPRSGMFLSTQQYDLGITVKTGGAAISSITHALLNSVDISPALTACIIPGRIGPGLLTLRCPGFSSLLPPATSRRAYTFDLAIELSDGTVVSETATWVILPTVEMPWIRANIQNSGQVFDLWFIHHNQGDTAVSHKSKTWPCKLDLPLIKLYYAEKAFLQTLAMWITNGRLMRRRIWFGINWSGTK